MFNRLISILLFVCFAIAAIAEPATVQTPSPVIHLEDMAGEPDGLGWCIDTRGRGLSDALHVHSCKPQGGDVQFRLTDTGQINSVAFSDKCAELTGPPEPGQTVALLDCDTANRLQSFLHNADFLQPADDQSLCLAAGPIINPAGPFSSRTLTLEPCNAVPSELVEWAVKE